MLLPSVVYLVVNTTNVFHLLKPLLEFTTGYNPGWFTATSRTEKEVLLTKVYRPLISTWSPFGTAAGFPTNLGVVAMPSDPVGGYIYTEEEGWVLYATPR